MQLLIGLRYRVDGILHEYLGESVLPHSDTTAHNHYRLALILRYVDDLSVSETAELLGKSLAATESLLARARTALTEEYEEQSDE